MLGDDIEEMPPPPVSLTSITVYMYLFDIFVLHAVTGNSHVDWQSLF